MDLPASFLALHAQGRFDYWGGVAYRDLDDAARARLLVERRPIVLWLRGIEWDHAPDDVAERDDLVPGVFPFAGNGGGDAYAFHPPWSEGAPEPPVLFVPHDEQTARYFAPTFARAVYRLWLEQGADWDDRYDGDDRDRALRSWAGILAPFLDDAARIELGELAIELSPQALATARDRFVSSLPDREFAATLPPTRYNPTFVKGDRARRLYAESIAFYERLVADGHARFAAQLAETRANLETHPA